ncbi:MAG TPA: tRNA (uridine(34)/cytosine(34)/5-carboxymethylaminomethyluridine(34)-2'-O)-methyltransferase TrmL [Pseudomonadales bacterium]|nr:tRNA (uridine(34)/cytosine(34)/5-carboxymethylaminomethyluridine(34)-2'-O)-methyltransferase TrmL [Pseudomonadales bacterium]
MLQVVLFQPEIPPNTGNVMRLCANTGARLHLIEPLGFELDDAKMRRAGLDYGDWSEVQVHRDLDAVFALQQRAALWAFTTKGNHGFSDVSYGADDLLLFGPETRGLPPDVLGRINPDRHLRIPMRPDSRSLNLSNAVAVVVYEAWRQFGYRGSV